MRSVDTNIVLRSIMVDDPEQAAVASELLNHPAFIPPTVLVEVAWALQSIYKLDRRSISEAISGVLDLPTITVANETGVRWALKRHAEAASDLADLLHLAYSTEAERFTTFDKKLASQAGPDAPMPVEQVP